MKTKILICILVSFVVISVILAAESIAGNGKGKGKGNAPALEKVEFIHYRKGFAKPPCDNDGVCEPGENPSCADCKKKEEPQPPEPSAACYAFMGQYGKRLLKWKSLPVSYVLNPANPYGLSEEFITAAISAGAEQWDAWTGAEIFNDTPTTGAVAYNVQDYTNAVCFNDYYSNPNIIGACMVWYNPATKQIVEFDIIFETDYVWGYAGPTDETGPGDPSVMDLQNIATHELGHAVGLADVYDEAECSEVTMYGLSENGETKKRTLEEADIIGIQRLYGAP